jgi:ubiquinone/menaquinone biosynthesis C-methylase UbiE
MITLPTDHTWKVYGRKAPYFSVSGEHLFLNENMTNERLSEFFRSGYLYVDELFAIIHNKIDPAFKADNILDFGCGPARMVIPFSKYADSVTGLDISSDMLNEAKKNCFRFGVNNVDFYQADKRLKCLKEKQFSLVHSYIVLQHLNTRRGENLLKLLIKHIADHGIGVIHLIYGDQLPIRRLVNFFKFRIPFLWYILRILGSVIRLRRFRNLPFMQMNRYNLNHIYSVLQNAGIREVYTVFTNHNDYFGATFHFMKSES